jgi:integral membrane protein
MTMREGMIRLFRVSAIVEFFTWSGLLIGMFFKYVVVHNDIGVRFFGFWHGIACIVYFLAAALVRNELRWTNRITAVALLVSVPPLMTWPFERWAIRRARALPPDDVGAIAEAA